MNSFLSPNNAVFSPRRSRTAAVLLLLVWLLGLANTGSGQETAEPLSPAYVEENPAPPFDMVYEPVIPRDAPSGPVFDPYETAQQEAWEWQPVPSGLIYHSYMAGTREPGLRAVSSYINGFGQVWDATLGGRAGLLRYGTTNSDTPEGWQFDLEGAAMPRIDPSQPSSPLIASDFRFGFPLTYGYGPFHAKVGYYHLSSHLGDEWLLLYPNTPRVNYVRDAVMLGMGYYFWNQFRAYGEIAYSSTDGGSEPLELQFGLEYSPVCNSFWGAPFAAVNGHLRQEVNFGGNLVVQAGWQWRPGRSARRFRVGVQFYEGYSEQWEFYNQHEQKLGGGVWYDF